MDIVRAAGEREIVFVYDSTNPVSAALAPVLRGLGTPLDRASLPDDDLAVALAGVGGVVSFSEPLVRLANDLARRLGTAANPPRTAEALTDKIIQREVLNEQGVSVIRATRVGIDNYAAAAEVVGFPAVLKPASGSASRRVRLVRNEEELRVAVERDRDRFLLEELLVGMPHPSADWLGDYVSVETVSDYGSHRAFCVTDKRPLGTLFRERGFVVPSRLPDALREEAVSLTIRALFALGVTTGVSHTELKLSPEGPRIIEVNGRLGGSIHRLLSRVTNVNPVELALDVSAGMSVDPNPAFSHHAATVYILPPEGVHRISRLRAVPELMAADGVWAVDGLYSVGDVVGSAAGSLSRVQTIAVEAADPDALHARLEAAEHLGYSGACFEPL